MAGLIHSYANALSLTSSPAAAENTRGAVLVYFPHVLIGFNCWPIGFQVQKRVGDTKASVNSKTVGEPGVGSFGLYGADFYVDPRVSCHTGSE